MKVIKILCLLTSVLFTCITATAQSTHYRSLSDSSIVKCLTGGYVREGKLHLLANDNYSMLDINQKRELLSIVAKEFPHMDITISNNNGHREMWRNSDAGVFLAEQWNNDDMHIEDYKPLELKRNGNSKVYYYVGGAYSYNDGYSNGTINLRGGTYLYKKVVDISTAISLGYTKTSDTTQFAGNIGVDGRYYLPIRPKVISLTPYIGGGVAWIFAPEKQLELRILAGACWFIGPGSLDVGLQYGIQSKLTATIGYTFRPHISRN